MKLARPTPTPKPPAGRWTLRDQNGQYLLKTAEYSGRISVYLGPKIVYSWTGIEDATLSDHADMAALVTMFPTDSVKLVEVRRREVMD